LDPIADDPLDGKGIDLLGAVEVDGEVEYQGSSIEDS